MTKKNEACSARLSDTRAGRLDPARVAATEARAYTDPMRVVELRSASARDSGLGQAHVDECKEK